MAERGASRKRPRGPALQQQLQSKQLTVEREAHLPSETANGHKRVTVRTADASSQTSPPASPRASGEDEADLSSLLLLPSAQSQVSIDSTSDWLTWVQLSGFAQSSAPVATAATETATTSTATAAVHTGGAPVNSAALAISSPSPLPAAYHSSSVYSSAFQLRARETAGGSPSSASSHEAREASSSGGGAARRGVEERGDTLHAAAPSTASMLHLRPSSAVVLPLNGLHAPLVDTHRRLLQAPHSASAQRPPLLLPWMNKQAIASSASRNYQT